MNVSDIFMDNVFLEYIFRLICNRIFIVMLGLLVVGVEIENHVFY